MTEKLVNPQDVVEIVSRETISRLESYAALIKKWNPRINLVAKSTISDLWDRHIRDSAQLFAHIRHDTRKLVDLGSGGGLPGLVLAVIAREKLPTLEVVFIESDSRKAAFLSAASHDLGLKTRVVNDRIEKAPSERADIVTARALAALPKLLPLVQKHLKPDGQALLMKGQKHAEEVEAALASFSFDLQKEPSLTNDQAVILKLTHIRSNVSP